MQFISIIFTRLLRFHRKTKQNSQDVFKINANSVFRIKVVLNRINKIREENLKKKEPRNSGNKHESIANYLYAVNIALKAWLN